MKRMILFVALLMLCTSCTALPAEERAFAVALCVEKAEDWRVRGRIPTYQTGGGYLTVTGEGDTLAAALADMDAAAPMHVNLSQLRLLVVDAALADSGELPAVLHALAERPDMRLQCAVAASDAPLKAVAEALKPAAGARLSKALDLLLDARAEQGAILHTTLADVLRMGERQSPVLIALMLEEKAIRLTGSVLMDGGSSLSSEETALLSLLLGSTKALRLTLPGVSADVRDANARIRLSEDFRTASVTLTLRTTASSVTADGLESILAQELLILLTRLSAEGCDVLGLGRKAILRMHDMAEWQDLDWPKIYRSLRWEVNIRVNGPA